MIFLVKRNEPILGVLVDAGAAVPPAQCDSSQPISLPPNLPSRARRAPGTLLASGQQQAGDGADETEEDGAAIKKARNKYIRT